MRDVRFYELASICNRYLKHEMMTQNERLRVNRLRHLLSEKAFKRFVAYHAEKMSFSEIAGLEGVNPSSVQRGVRLAEMRIILEDI